MNREYREFRPERVRATPNDVRFVQYDETPGALAFTT
jgi:hypothetical protein